ncbi:unnamed protein product [Cladocopium goreaui]|uniref:Voltage-dependent L-type calcium channel subunit alpha-1C n=1 Tax=Cladocopium goreaui TaxID=2562237 RepID=A0A9P1DVZ5_9DINO|nr:unnamed protein product [Cladocopium goreaui]
MKAEVGSMSVDLSPSSRSDASQDQPKKGEKTPVAARIRASFTPNLFSSFEQFDKSLKRVAARADSAHRKRKYASVRQKDSLKGAREGCLKRIVKHSGFDFFFAFVVLSNSIFIGVEVQLGLEIQGSRPLAIYIFQYAYTFLFSVELGLRLLADWRFYLCDEWMWTWLDIFIVLSSLWELAVDLIYVWSGSQAAEPERFAGVINLKALRVIRVTRIVKAVRLMRIFRFVMALRTLITSILHTLQSLFWALALLVLIVYVFAVLFVQAVQDHILNPDNPALPEREMLASQRYFSSLPDTMLLAASPAPPATAEWHGRCGLVTGARQDLAANHDVNYTGRPGLIVENATTQSNGPPEMTRNGKKWQLTIDVPRSGRQIADALSEYGSVDVVTQELRDLYTSFGFTKGLTLVLSADAMNQLGITLSRWQVGKTGMAETKFKFGRDWMAEELVDFLKQQGPRKTWDEIKDQPPQTANTRGRPAKRQAKEPDERHRSRSAAEKPEKGDENKDPMEVEKTQLDSQTQPEAIDKQSSKPTSQSLGNLTDALTQNWTLADQGGCGDCGYRALIDNFHYQTTGETLSKEECIKNANLFRTEVVRHVRKHQDRYENHVRGGKEAFPAFCDNALKQTHWICGLLLQAAAEVKSCCIVVWNQKDEVLERFTFAPEWSPQGMPRMKKEAPILVVYRNDKHYQSVRPPQDQDGMTKVPKHWARETAKPEAEALGGAGPSVGESPKTLHTLSPGSSHAPSLHTLPASSFRGSSGGGVMITRAPSLHSLVPSASSPPRLRAVVHGHAAGGGSSGALARPHPPRSPSLLTLAASPHSCDRSGTKDKGAVKNDNTECDFRPDTAPYPRHLKRLDAKSQSRPRNFLKVAEPGVAQNAGKAAQAAGHLVTEVLPPDAMRNRDIDYYISNLEPTEVETLPDVDWQMLSQTFFQALVCAVRAAAPDMLQRVSPALLRILREFWADIWNRRQISWDDIWDDLVTHTPPRPAPDSWPSLTPEQLRSATKCSRGSAPGLDGWRAEELSLFSDEMWQDAGCPPETVSTSITLLGFQFMGVTQRKAKDRELTRLTEAKEVLRKCRLRDAWRIRKYEEFLELDRPAPRRLEPPPFYSGDRLWPALRLRASAGSVIVYIIIRFQVAASPAPPATAEWHGRCGLVTGARQERKLTWHGPRLLQKNLKRKIQKKKKKNKSQKRKTKRTNSRI